jgi:hypothetical protein
LLLSLPVLSQSGGDYELNRWAISGSRSSCAGGDYTLSGIVGQAEAERLSGGSFTLLGGFGTGGRAASPVHPLSADDAEVNGGKLKGQLQKQGIEIRAGSLRGLAEEAPIAYKDISRVVEVVQSSTSNLGNCCSCCLHIDLSDKVTILSRDHMINV